MQSHKNLIKIYNLKKDTILYEKEIFFPKFNNTKNGFLSWLDHKYPDKNNQMLFLETILKNVAIKRDVRLKQEIENNKDNLDLRTLYINSIYNTCPEEIINCYSHECKRNNDFKIQIYNTLSERFYESENNYASEKDFFVIHNNAVSFFMDNIEKGFEDNIYDTDSKYESNIKKVLEYYRNNNLEKNKHIHILIMHPDASNSISYKCHSLNLLTIKDAVNHPDFKRFINNYDQEDLEDSDSTQVIADFFSRIESTYKIFVKAIIKNKNKLFDVNLINKNDFINMKSSITNNDLEILYNKKETKS